MSTAGKEYEEKWTSSSTCTFRKLIPNVRFWIHWYGSTKVTLHPGEGIGLRRERWSGQEREEREEVTLFYDGVNVHRSFYRKVRVYSLRRVFSQEEYCSREDLDAVLDAKHSEVRYPAWKEVRVDDEWQG